MSLSSSNAYHSRLDFVNASEDDLKNLADACAPATFARNQEDIHDETYRRAGVLDTAEFAIGFDPVSSGVIGSIEDLLLEGHKRSDVRLVHGLYKLNVYGEHIRCSALRYRLKARYSV